MEVTVITPTIPERTELLGQAIASVAKQNHPVKGHFIGVDLEREGPSPIRNRLINSIETEWTAFLDDDDILMPNHFEVMAPFVNEADLIWTWCDSVGRGNFNPNSHFNERRLRQDGNYIPITVAVRTSLLKEVGGFSDARLEDWDLWIRLLDAGGRFKNIPTITWTYRFLGENRTFT
jgi:glycosyltransferase involved in cell wall biosynthesis